MESKPENTNISTKDYIDMKIEALKDYIDANLAADRKAVDQYSKTNDEWKTLHNGLQRKLDDDKDRYVTKETLDRRVKLIFSYMLTIISIVLGLIAIYQLILRSAVSK